MYGTEPKHIQCTFSDLMPCFLLLSVYFLFMTDLSVV